MKNQVFSQSIRACKPCTCITTTTTTKCFSRLFCTHKIKKNKLQESFPKIYKPYNYSTGVTETLFVFTLLLLGIQWHKSAVSWCGAALQTCSHLFLLCCTRGGLTCSLATNNIWTNESSASNHHLLDLSISVYVCIYRCL